MGAYQYTALGPEGREKKGLLEGESARQVRQRLREQGLTPLAVEEAAGRDRGESGRGGSRRGISATDLAVATRQLATLVASGLPLEEA
ncbi:MAG TPA: type II secretion system protein GspF, partial [Gammaproteobacteria bacterium]|nr:type II secretion system protein GspF [Gammaproteobacteria bacterium]